MRVRRVLLIFCAALLVLAASAGADEVAPSATVQPDAAPSVQPSPTTSASTTAPEATPAPAATAVPDATPAATPAPTLTAVPEATPVAQTTPTPTPTAVAEPARAAQATPTPTVMAPPVGVATAAEQATRAETVTVAQAAQEPPPPAPAPPAASGCATPVEVLPVVLLDGSVEGVVETPSVDGVCRVSAAVCSILGTDGDDVLTGSPFDDIVCGLGGNDRLDGGDGDDVLLGGEGDDELVGRAGYDCIVGGPGTDSAISFGRPGTVQTTSNYGEQPEVEQPAAWWSGSVHGIAWAVGVTFDAKGRCTGAVHVIGLAVSPPPPLSRPKAPSAARYGSAPAGATPVAVRASTSGPGGLRLGLPDGRLTVRNDVVRVPVSCSAEMAAELVLLAGSQRIAHKRFTCTPPERTTVRVRLNKAGRKLVARDDRVQARLLVMAAGRTVSRQVLLVSPDS
jgi:RTX calcium-binding nonapeptide repeat (4 copies)